MIEISNLDFDIDGFKILKDINLKIYRGEFVGIIGANGSGKTTLLKCINGINKTDKKIKIFNKYILDYDYKELARKISYMSQNTIMPFDFICKKIVEFGRYPYKKVFEYLTEDEIKLIEYYLKKTDSEKLSNKLINSISGGEKQRVLFAKLLVQETEIALLDEPTSALDIKYEEQLFKMICEEKRDNNIIVMSIHNIRNAIKYCSRLVLLKDGIILADGRPDEVITNENILDAYGIDVEVYYNTFSGQIDFYVK